MVESVLYRKEKLLWTNELEIQIEFSLFPFVIITLDKDNGFWILYQSSSTSTAYNSLLLDINLSFASVLWPTIKRL